MSKTGKSRSSAKSNQLRAVKAASKSSEDKVVKLASARAKRKAPTKGLAKSERDLLVIECREKARKLARSILRKWHSRLDLDEINSVVDLSLCEAVKRFDPTKGASFITFLYYHLRGNLIRTVSAAANANAVPSSDSSDDDSKKRKSDGAFNAIEIADALTGRESILPDEALFKKELIRLSFEACDKLDELEREVIHRIFIQERQLNHIAASLGYSRCHISRVKKKALETLNQEMEMYLDSQLNLERGQVYHGNFRPTSERRKVKRRKPRSKVASRKFAVGS